MKVLVAQGGGPTAVINRTLQEIVTTLTWLGVRDIYGALEGIRGVIRQDFVDLARTPPENLVGIGRTPGAALASTRDKADHEYCRKIFRVLQAHGISTFIYIGGNDTAETLRIVAEYARAAVHPLRCIHVAKTVDNDLPHNYFTPGYPSAALFVREIYVALNCDHASLRRIHLGVIMGRNAGFLTAASALARQKEGDGPHLIYLPERPFVLERFLADIQKVHDEKRRCLVAVSEGVRDESGTLIAERINSTLEKDPHGNKQLSGSGLLGDWLADQVKKRLGTSNVRSQTLGYELRGFRRCVPPRDQEAAAQAGRTAASWAVRGGTDGSIAVTQILGEQRCELVPLAAIANKTRVMPDHYISSRGNDVTLAFCDYLRPLIGELEPYYELDAPAVEKIEVSFD